MRQNVILLLLLLSKVIIYKKTTTPGSGQQTESRTGAQPNRSQVVTPTWRVLADP